MSVANTDGRQPISVSNYHLDELRIAPPVHFPSYLESFVSSRPCYSFSRE